MKISKSTTITFQRFHTLLYTIIEPSYKDFLHYLQSTSIDKLNQVFLYNIHIKIYINNINLFISYFVVLEIQCSITSLK